MKKVAITGDLGAGKSTVARALNEKGAYVVCADEIVHRLLSQNVSLKKELIEFLGIEIVQENGALDRKKISEKVFHHPEQLKILEKKIHPYVFETIEKEYEKAKRQKNISFFVVEIPLLFEVGAEKNYDFVVAVVASKEICQKRFLEKGFDFLEYQRRTERQMTSSEKVKRADFVIVNEGTVKDLQEQVANLLVKMQSLQGK